LGIKSRAKNLLAQLGYELRRIDRPAQNTFSRDADILAFYLNPAVSSGQKLRIIQVGANDGHTEDPLVDILTAGNVEAVLIEPLPDLGEALRKKYADNRRVRIETVGISDRSETIEFFVAIRDEDGKIADSRISSFDHDHVERHIRYRRSVEPAIFGANPRVEKIKVQCITIAQVMERAGWSVADVLVIDAEGLDAVIVNNVLDAGSSFRMIYFEHLNIPIVEGRTLSGKLDKAGYALVTSGKDTLAVKPEWLGKAGIQDRAHTN